MRISFLLSFTPNPRMKKRIRFLKINHEVSLIYWKRSNEYIWGDVPNDICSEEIRIQVDGGNLIKRVIPTIQFAKAALNSMKKCCPECVYVQNPDMLFIAEIYRLFCNSHIKIVYEVADIHEILIQPQRKLYKKIIQQCLRLLERRLCKNINLLVLTSDKYYECYYKKFVPYRKYIYVPNMPEKRLFRSYTHKKDGPFTVGFVGAVRFPKQIKLLVQACQESNVNLEIIGSFLDTDLEYYCRNRGVTCYGKYNYEEEISKLYGRLDCVFSVYPVEDCNVDIALPNKLYESIICELPIIGAQDTYLGEIIQKHKIGITVDCNCLESYKTAIERLRTDTQFYQQIVYNCQKMKVNCYSEKYSEQLKCRIEQLNI